jgi:integration host factor subunit beta
MTKADLVERVTAQISRTAGPMISKKDCARVVDAFLESIKEALQGQKNIEVRGFGTFKIRHRKTRMARNPRTGSPVEVSARPVPVFKPSKELRAMVAGIDISELERRRGGNDGGVSTSGAALAYGSMPGGVEPLSSDSFRGTSST